MPSIRVLLADDHALFRRGVARLLATESDFEVVGEAADGLQALEKTRELKPDVILMDVSMPVMDGLEATLLIKAEWPDARIVILTVSDGERNVFEAIRCGASACLPKNVEPQVLYGTLRGSVRGGGCISRAMAARLLEKVARDSRRTAVPPTSGVGLTPREQEVLELVAKGKSNEEIAAALAVAASAVQDHLDSILEKLLRFDERVRAVAHVFH